MCEYDQGTAGTLFLKMHIQSPTDGPTLFVSSVHRNRGVPEVGATVLLYQHMSNMCDCAEEMAPSYILYLIAGLALIL